MCWSTRSAASWTARTRLPSSSSSARTGGQPFQLEAQRGDLLAEIVVDVPRDAPPLGFLQREHAPDELHVFATQLLARGLESPALGHVDHGHEELDQGPLVMPGPTGQLQRPVARGGVDVHLFAACCLVGPVRGDAEVAEETATVRRHDRRQERRADQRRARLAEQRGAGQVDFTHDAGAIERAVAVRRAVVQLDEAVARLLELVQRLDQLLVLRPQLLLVDLEVVTEQRPLVVGGRGNWRGARAAARTSHVITPRAAWPRSAPDAGLAHPATPSRGPRRPRTVRSCRTDGRTIWRTTVPVSHSSSPRMAAMSHVGGRTSSRRWLRRSPAGRTVTPAKAALP